MTRIYHFRPIFWNIFYALTGLLFLYDLICRLGTAFDVNFLAIFHCPGSAVIACPFGDRYCIGIDVLLLLFSIGALSYGKHIALDLGEKKLQTWSSLFGLKFSRTTQAVSDASQVTLTQRRVETAIRVALVGLLKVTYFFLELVGDRRFEIWRFGPGQSGRARRIGQEIANHLQLPFIDYTDRLLNATLKDPMVITRTDVKEILERWQQGLVTAAEVVRWSEDRHPDEGYRYGDVNWDDWEAGKVESVINEVLLCIEDLGQEHLNSHQIPIFLRFLDSAPGNFKSARKEFHEIGTISK